ncbi:transglutaminase family protein [Pseudooceanicola sp.]|uniref:transglutaminase family protein n=1 Tax=Pseudooceanicola sp. TaxID=1914328 RepID=UPI0035C75AC2
MHLHIDVKLHYRFPVPNTVFLTLEAARTEGQTVHSQSLLTGNATQYRISGDAGVGERFWAVVPGCEMVVDYAATVEITRTARLLPTIPATPVHLLPAEAAPYLRPSRYCQSDKFVAFVGKRFGHLQGGAKVAAIRDWIEASLTYMPGASDSDTHVLETFASRQGVCRDYAHLLCAMVRAAQIPARAVACYGPDVTPADFHAVAQVWLDGAWHLVDATGMGTPEDLAVIAVGRDAYDIAFMESQAPAELLWQEVRVTRG